MFLKSEIIKEFVFRIDGVDHPVYGRIVKSDEVDHLPYGWDISHHYRPSENAIGVYYPSVMNAVTPIDAECLLDAYIGGFKNIDVTFNEDY